MSFHYTDSIDPDFMTYWITISYSKKICFVAQKNYAFWVRKHEMYTDWQQYGVDKMATIF